MRIFFAVLVLAGSIEASHAAPLSAPNYVDESTPPPRDARFVEKQFELLTNRDMDQLGSTALEIAPAKWKHAETDNFILHYRRQTEGRRVAREIEYDLWYVANTLGAGKDRYTKKSHVFIFQDMREWKQFVLDNSKQNWVASFAKGDELFLHVGGMGEGFDSRLLGHETAHAVVARLYPQQRWPMWLSEGFAEFMGNASVAARNHQFRKGPERNLTNAGFSINELTAITEYPEDREKIHLLYQTSEKLVRFLMSELPKQQFTTFVDAMLEGLPFYPAIFQVYGDKIKSIDDLQKRFARFDK